MNYVVDGTEVRENPNEGFCRREDAERIAAASRRAIAEYERFVGLEGEFFALLCPEKLSLRNGELRTESGTLVVRAVLGVSGSGGRWFHLYPRDNPFWHAHGQGWVAHAHLDLLLRLLYRAVEVGLEEALAEQRPRWIGGGDACRWDVPFSASPYPVVLVPPGYVK